MLLMESLSKENEVAVFKVAEEHWAQVPPVALNEQPHRPIIHKTERPDQAGALKQDHHTCRPRLCLEDQHKYRLQLGLKLAEGFLHVWMKYSCCLNSVSKSTFPFQAAFTIEITLKQGYK